MTRFSRLLAHAVLACAPALAAQNYQVTDHWKIGGQGGWDYLAVDSSAHRLYVTHNNRVEVLDTNTGKVVGAISGLSGTHGVAFDSDGHRGYISDGGANEVVVFDRGDLAKKASIATGKNPDGILFEPTTKTVWAFNGRSNDVTVIDPNAGKAIATVKLPGKPEFPQADGAGSVFVNIEDKNSIVKLSASGHSITATFPLKGCESPSGMAIDRKAHRLFSVCDGGKMAVVDYAAGKLLALASIGDSPDAAGFDPRSGMAFSSNGDGTLSVVDTGKSGFPAVQTLKTSKGARTMAFDESTGTIYTVSSQFGPPPAPTADRPHPRASVVPDSFEVLVIKAKK